MRPIAALALAFLFAACGKDEPKTSTPPPEEPPAVGTYELDVDNTFQRMQLLRRATTLDDVKKVKIRFDLREDGTFRGRTESPDGLKEAEGTWKADGNRVTVVTTKMDGETLDEPKGKTLVHRDGALWFDTNDETWPIVLRRR